MDAGCTHSKGNKTEDWQGTNFWPQSHDKKPSNETALVVGRVGKIMIFYIKKSDFFI